MSPYPLPAAMKGLLSRYLHLAVLTVLFLLVLLAIQTVLLEETRRFKAIDGGSSSTLQQQQQPAGALKKFLPSCIIIGVRKGGTRALLDMLSLHSAIRAAKTEVHFFDVEKNYQKGYTWYKEHMPLAEEGTIVVEKSPSYFVTRSVPQRVHRMDKSIQLLLVVRDPVTRLISDYTQLLFNRLEKGLQYKSFHDFAFHPGNGSINVGYEALVKSVYINFIRNWLEFFPLSQIHVVNGEQLIRKPWSELQKVESFLGLRSEIGRDLFFFNATKGFHCMRRGGKERCLNNSKGRPHPKGIPKEDIAKLRKFYAPYNYQFYDAVGKDFGWPEE